MQWEEKEKKAEEIFKVMMAENFPKLMRDTKPQIQEAEKTPSTINIKNLYQCILYSNGRKPNTRRKPWEKPEKNNT